MIDRDKKILQIHIPKTGGQSLSSLFFPEKPFLKIDAASLSGGTGTPDVGVWNHLTYDEILKFSKIKHEELKGYIKFSCIRNPWSRIVSAWIYFGASSRPFPEFVDLIKNKENGKLYSIGATDRTLEQIFRPQIDFLKHSGKVIIDHLVRFENLNEDIEKVLEAVGMDVKTEIPHINSSKHQHYSSYYDQKTVDKVGEIYKDDIVAFNYKFERG